MFVRGAFPVEEVYGLTRAVTRALSAINESNDDSVY